MRPWNGSMRPADERPRAGARHARVAVAVDVVVDRPGAAGGEVAAEQRPEDGREAAGRAGWATIIVTTVVQSSSEMIRGFVSAM